MKPLLPGLHPDRLTRLIESAVARCELNLRGLTVVTEAATGAYVVTPLLAALGGAGRVYAVARDSRHGTAAAAVEATKRLAVRLGVADRITFTDRLSEDMLAAADIVTNSGHVRPITAAVIERMRPSAVIPLMYENWEFRPADVDLDACGRKGIRVGGTNERHPAVGVFEFLGILAVKLLSDAGVCVYGGRIALICDNEFGAYIEAGLRAAGADVLASAAVASLGDPVDAVLVAKTPGESVVLSGDELRSMAERSPGAVLAQYFGDLDREAVAALGIPVWPEQAPAKGHMGILLSAVGPEPIVRLQAGGLKAGEVLHAGWTGDGPAADSIVQPLTVSLPMDIPCAVLS